MSSLITVTEVLELTPRAQGTDPRIPDAILKQKEEGLFRVWLGYDWYADLLADLNSAAATPYIEGRNYVISDQVIWKGRQYTCILTTTNEQKPNDTTYWTLTPKFTTGANQTLWDNYLKYVVAWTVYHSSVVYEALRVTQLGVQRYGDNESFKNRAADIKEVAAFKKEIWDDLNLMLQNMDRYLRENATTFPKYRPNQQSDDDIDAQVGRRRKNYGFSTW